MAKEIHAKYVAHEALIEKQFAPPSLQEMHDIEDSLDMVLHARSEAVKAHSSGAGIYITGKAHAWLPSEQHNSETRLGLQFDYDKWREDDIEHVCIRVLVEEIYLNPDSISGGCKREYLIAREGAKVELASYIWRPIVSEDGIDISAEYFPVGEVEPIFFETDECLHATQVKYPDDMAGRTMTSFDADDLLGILALIDSPHVTRTDKINFIRKQS